jgi:hypothetical protein
MKPIADGDGGCKMGAKFTASPTFFPSRRFGLKSDYLSPPHNDNIK